MTVTYGLQPMHFGMSIVRIVLSISETFNGNCLNLWERMLSFHCIKITSNVFVTAHHFSLSQSPARGDEQKKKFNHLNIWISIDGFSLCFRGQRLQKCCFENDFAFCACVHVDAVINVAAKLNLKMCRLNSLHVSSGIGLRGIDSLNFDLDVFQLKLNNNQLKSPPFYRINLLLAVNCFVNIKLISL